MSTEVQLLFPALRRKSLKSGHIRKICIDIFSRYCNDYETMKITEAKNNYFGADFYLQRL
jgi:hypothetical protein